MTTIVGLKTTTGLDAIVLASDFTKTMIYPNNDMEVRDMKKIYHTNNFAFTISGNIDLDLLPELWKNLKSKKSKDEENYIDVKKRLEDGFFEEIRLLNQIQCDSDIEFQTQQQTAFMFATRYSGKVGLYKVYPLGQVEESNSNYICLGSGTEYIEEMLEREYEFKSLDGPKIDLRKAVKLAQESISLANRDMFSGSDIVDFAIITKDSIKYYGNSLRKNLKIYKNQQINEIIKKYY